MITEKQWNQAQINERAAHDKDKGRTILDHMHTYKQYFKLLGMSFEQAGKNIMEIGPADYPAVCFCNGLGPVVVVVEPMPSDNLTKLLTGYNFHLIKERAETMPFNVVNEIWLFNVLQHVQDPDKIIQKCKESCDVIRFFEPINYGTDSMHLHNFTLQYFENHFGNAVRHYPCTPNAINFHTHECAYGSYKTNK